MREPCPSARKGAIHERLLARYEALVTAGEKREFRRALAAAVGRSEQSVARWVGERLPLNGPPSTVLEKCLRFLEERGA